MAKLKQLVIPRSEAPAIVALELSQEEVDALYAVCGAVGGAPDGRRGIFSDWPWSIRQLLEPHISMNLRDYVSGSVYFTDEPQVQKKY